jgi:hypothetical protein
MFAVGLPPPQQKKRNRVELTLPHTTNMRFLGRPSSWLIVPRTNLNFFHKQFDLCSTDSFVQPYNYGKYFTLKYPADSIGYAMGRAAFSSITQTYDELADSVEALYTKNMKLRWTMKSLLNLWRSRQVRIINETDLATQEIPRKPIIFTRWSTKTAYQFEAMTILHDSLSRLLNHDQLFLNPLPPRNPFTNILLTYGELVSMHNQLRKVGKTHWLWEAFVTSNFNVRTLEKAYEVPMKLRCLDLMMSDTQSLATLDFILDFIIGEYTHHIMYKPPGENTAFRVLTTRWDTPKVQEWIELCVAFWKNHIRGRDEDNAHVHHRSEVLIQSIKSWHAI